METASNKEKKENTQLNQDEQLHTDKPMSEKDEVKQAEENTGNSAIEKERQKDLDDDIKSDE